MLVAVAFFEDMDSTLATRVASFTSTGTATALERTPARKIDRAARWIILSFMPARDRPVWPS